MQHLTLAQVFGVGASQDVNALVISKASLLGLSASANNTAESLLAAILITALQCFQGDINDENGNALTDENSETITFDNSEVFEEVGLIQWETFLIKRKTILYRINQVIAFVYAPN
ncbi:MAG: hypothetical protein V7L25_31020 [Nostoc sp.]|uniref:hypothetical protein n=1 Tax=Nostoc sp. TaxID=1180 RepID=UPI002FEF0F97